MRLHRMCLHRMCLHRPSVAGRAFEVRCFVQRGSRSSRLIRLKIKQLSFEPEPSPSRGKERVIAFCKYEAATGEQRLKRSLGPLRQAVRSANNHQGFCSLTDSAIIARSCAELLVRAAGKGRCPGLQASLQEGCCGPYSGDAPNVSVHAEEEISCQMPCVDGQASQRCGLGQERWQTGKADSGFYQGQHGDAAIGASHDVCRLCDFR